MTNVENNVAKVYSADKKLWLNMSREEAYKAGEENLKLFNYADKDGDKVISQKELNRYNSPVVIENYEEISNSRVVTQGKVKFNNLFVGEGKVSLTSQVITNKEEEFYAGLELKEVSAKGSEIFYAMDMNHDGYLSQGEMKIAAEIKTRLNKALKQIQESFEHYAKCCDKGIELGAEIGGGVGAIAIAGSIFLAAEDGAIIGGVGGGLFGAIAGAFIGGCIGFGIAYFGGKSVGEEANYEKIFNEAMGNLKSHSYAKYVKETFINGVKAMSDAYFE